MKRLNGQLRYQLSFLWVNIFTAQKDKIGSFIAFLIFSKYFYLVTQTIFYFYISV